MSKLGMSIFCFPQFCIQDFFAFGGWKKATSKYKTWTLKFQFCFIHDKIRARQGISLDLPTTFIILMIQVINVAHNKCEVWVFKWLMILLVTWNTRLHNNQLRIVAIPLWMMTTSVTLNKELMDMLTLPSQTNVCI